MKWMVNKRPRCPSQSGGCGMRRPIDYLLDMLSMVSLLGLLYLFLVYGASIEGGAL